jgi:hypothetical protein
MKITGSSILACVTLSLTMSSASFAVPQAAAQSAQGSDPLAAIRSACAEDVQRFCGTVQQGGGRVVACLKDHKDSLSDGCRQAAGLPVKPNRSSAPSSDSSSSTPPAASAGAHDAPSASRTAPGPVTIAGERFTQREIIDTQQGGIRAATVHIPESWHFESKIEWNYRWVEVPVNPSWHAENPANAESYFQYESWRLADLYVAPQVSQYSKQPKLGDRYFSGQIHMVPVAPLQAMAAFIKQVRGNANNLKWLGQQDLPDLAKALRIAPSPNQRGVAIKIGYDLNGKPVEEAFFGVYYFNKAGTQAVQAGHQALAANQVVQTNWGIQALQSFRAPAGTLDKRMPVYCVIAKSVQYEPAWSLHHRAISATLTEMFNQNLKRGWDQIRAADALSDQTMRQQAQFLDSVSRQEAAMRSSGGSVDGFLRPDGSGGGGGGARTSSDNVSDLINNVDSMNDPSTGGTKKVSNLGGYNHFTDGFGHYITYDDPNATPENQGVDGSWTRMTQAP